MRYILRLLIIFIIINSSFVFGESAESGSSDSTKAEKKERAGLPLEPERKLKMTAEEGSWMSVDVSPDGNTLVFDLLGDLYTLPVKGGEATRLSKGMSFDCQPRFSPDGSQVVFISDSSGNNNVWILTLNDKKLKQITNSKGTEGIVTYQSPEWTPDGKYIVASFGKAALTPATLWMFHIDGGSGIQLIKEPENLKTIGAAFGKDQRYIWFAQRIGDWQYNAIFPQYQIARYDRDNGKTIVMTSRFGSAFRPALSPDGQFMVYGTRYNHKTGLIIREMNNGNERWLAYPVQRDEQESRATIDVLPGYSFTPDSKSIIASYGGKLWQVPIDGSSPKNIPFQVDVDIEIGPQVHFNYEIDDSTSFNAQQIRNPKISPDGKHLAFSALDRIWVMHYPDGKPERLTKMETGEYYPVWAPNGQWIAFSTWNDQEGGFLYKAKAGRSGSPVRLTDVSSIYTDPAWTPDGRRIAAFRLPERTWQDAVAYADQLVGSEFVYVDAEGGPLTVISTAEGKSNLHFRDDQSDRLYAYSEEKGLISFRWDGTDEKAHLKVTGKTLPRQKEPVKADFILVAPKGDQAIAQILNHLYTVTVPYSGGETPNVSIVNPDNAIVPTKKLTTITGQFPSWSADGRKVYWSIGNVFFTYDLDQAKAFADSLRIAAADTNQADSLKQDKDKKKPVFKPGEKQIRITAKRDIPQGVVLLQNARVITMKGYEIFEKGDILVKNNRIAAVGENGRIQVPEEAVVLDLSGKTIIPGFIDTHYHAQWLMPEVHNTQVWQYLTNLAYGVTTTRDPQTSTTDILTYSDRVETGAMTGPRIYSTGPGVFWSEDIKNYEDAQNIIRRYSDYYDTKTLKMYVSGSRQQRQWIIKAAKKLRLMPTTEGALDFKMNLTMAIDGYSGQEHCLPVFPLYSDVVRLFARSNLTYTPTLLVNYGGPFAENYYFATENVYGSEKLRHFMPHDRLASRALRRGNNPGPGGWFHTDEYTFRNQAVFVKDLIQAGGRVGVGSHGQLQGLAYHWELWSMQSGGLSEHDALRTATIYGAAGIGFDNDIGSIEAGKLADLVILNKNPLENIRNTNTIYQIMKNGRLYDGNTLDQEWPRKVKLPVQFWQYQDPKTAAGIR